MVKTVSLIILVFLILSSCGRDINKQNGNTLSCILLGYDSLAYYYGNSDQVQNSVSGVISDSNFVRTFITSAKDHSKLTGFKIAIKPTASANVVIAFKWLVDLLNSNELQSRSIDKLDANEIRNFNTISIQHISERSSKLILPNEENNVAVSIDPVGNDVVTILLFEENGMYIYLGDNINSGKRFQYAELKDFFLGRKALGDFKVIIKPSDNSTYKNTVDILDEMSNNHISNYKLLDITGPEQEFMSTHFK